VTAVFPNGIAKVDIIFYPPKKIATFAQKVTK